WAEAAHQSLLLSGDPVDRNRDSLLMCGEGVPMLAGFANQNRARPGCLIRGGLGQQLAQTEQWKFFALPRNTLAAICPGYLFQIEHAAIGNHRRIEAIKLLAGPHDDAG